MGNAAGALDLVKSVLVFAFVVRSAIPLITGALGLFTGFGDSHGTGDEKERNIAKALGGAASLLLSGLVGGLITTPNFGSGNSLGGIIDLIGWLAQSICAVAMLFGMNRFLTAVSGNATGEERDKGAYQALGGAAGMLVIEALVAFIPTTIF